MSSTYKDIFDTRGDLYNEASNINPTSRNIERDLLLQMMDIKSGQKICDAPAGGGYLADGILELTKRPENIHCIEPSIVFSKKIAGHFVTHNCPLNELPLNDCYFDSYGSLAGLHHILNKQAFINEAYRVIKPGGKIAIADAASGSHVAMFLNDSVDKYSVMGHKGVFLKIQEFQEILTSAGFVDIVVEQKQYNWEFNSLEELVEYCKTLFGMVKSTLDDVENELRKYFNIKETHGQHLLPWSLIYARGLKPPI
ncbi:MAG: methyltransferase domain-containing protein [Cyclobacteriaceae bacterium]